MSTSAFRSVRGRPAAAVAAAAAIALLAMPAPANGTGGQSRTALLTLTGPLSLAQLADDVAALGGQVLETLDLSDSLIVKLPASAAIPAGAAEVPDVAMKVNGTQTADSVTPWDPTFRGTIGADSLAGDLGKGVKVAIVDTGVADHPDLDNVEHANVSDSPDGDGYGHGTFLAGIIAGARGVAPAATLLDVQVADGTGETSLSTVLKGLEVVFDDGEVDVVNVSLSSEQPLPPGFDPLSRALERLWGTGITVVVAAGNNGDGWGTVGSPGNDPVLLTVGALDENHSVDRGDDVVAPFSARGSKFTKGKPDLVAPGVSIVSTAAEGSQAAESAAWVQDQYMPGTGTSMSAAVVTGASAAVLGVNPALRPNGVKALLTGTTYTSNDLEQSDGAGHGALDLAAAIEAAPDAPVDVRPGRPGADPAWGPSEDDAEAWAAFAEAWDSGDFGAVKAAWAELSWQTQQWASRMWMMSVLADSLGLPDREFNARSWAARSWAFDGWLARSWAARSWAARSWAARSWAIDDWVARSWAARSWAARSWAARSWAVDEWLARSWAARSWAARSWAARSWAARSWAARSWADEDWAARSWAARSWATGTWDAGSWSMEG